MGSSDRNEGGGGVERPVLGCGLVAAEMAGWTRKGGDALRVASGLGWGRLSCVGESGRGPTDPEVGLEFGLRTRRP